MKSGKNAGKKKYNEDQIGQISDIEEAYEELDVAELKEDTLNNLFVLLEMVPQNDDLEQSRVDARPRGGSFIDNIMKDDAKNKKAKSFGNINTPEKMQTVKYSLNKERAIYVDNIIQDTHKNELVQDNARIKCAIVASKVREQKEYYVFRSRVLIFKVETRVRGGSRPAKWSVSRYEADFYTLRKILIQ